MKALVRVTVPLTLAQKRVVQRVYEMALYASNSTDYGVRDEETGDFLGTDPSVERDLEYVRQLFKLEPEPEE